MAGVARVTVTLPSQLVRDIDRLERNRSRFILEAVHRELQRRRRRELARSLRHPHAETAKLAEAGFEEWAKELPAEETAELVEPGSGRPIRWVPGKGWGPARK